jgi:hypothetical protein
MRSGLPLRSIQRPAIHEPSANPAMNAVNTAVSEYTVLPMGNRRSRVQQTS